IARDASFLANARGKAVKVVHTLLPHLPLDHDYCVILIQRNMDEVLASQRKMLERAGRIGAALTDAQLQAVYRAQLEQLSRWFATYPKHIRVLEVEYRDLTTDPLTAARAVNSFLGGALDESAMAAAIEPSLHRNRL